MRRLQGIFVLAVCLLPLTAPASVLCTPESVSELLAYGLLATHPAFQSGAAFAYVLNAELDCQVPTLVYCVNETTSLCLDSMHNQGPDIEEEELVWVLNNYFPAVPEEPDELSTPDERAAAVQLALWHFADGLDISEPGSGLPLNVFDAARAIIDAALTATVPPTPTSLTLTTAWPLPTVQVTATLYDQNHLQMPNVEVDWEITNGLSGTGMTDANGRLVVSWTWGPGDVLTFDVDYAVPVGLRWRLQGCQDLIQGVVADGHLTMTWQEEPASGATPATWGRVKSLYR